MTEKKQKIDEIFGALTNNMPSIDEIYSQQEFILLDPNEIIEKDQIRFQIDTNNNSFKSLVESIKKQGVLSPVLVTKTKEGYRLVAGHRRVLAAKQAGLNKIPARFLKNISNEDITTIQLIENTVRDALSSVEIGAAFVKLFKMRFPNDNIIKDLNSFSFSPEALDQEKRTFIQNFIVLSKKSHKTLANLVKSVLFLPDELINAVKENKVKITTLYNLLKAKEKLSDADFKNLIKKIINEPITPKEINKYIEQKTKTKNTDVDNEACSHIISVIEKQITTLPPQKQMDTLIELQKYINKTLKKAIKQ